MSKIGEQGTGEVGAFLGPSARPSIHNHWGCQFAAGERMVRYSVPRNIDKNDGPDDEQGRDVVDNIMSKHAYAIGLQNEHRRKSLDAAKNQKYQMQEYESDVLSKSVPATLPSQLYYRNNTSTSDDEEDVNESHHSNASINSTGTPNRSNISRNGNNVPNPTIDPQIIDSVENKSSFTKVVFSLGLVGAMCAVVCTGGFNVGGLSNVNSYNQFSFYTDVVGLGEKYNVDENSILQVQSGIDTIFERQDVGSFIFVYNSNANDFKLREFNMFVNDVSYAASKYLRNDSTPLTYTVIEGTRLDMDDPSELICRYKEQLASSGVMLVRHLEAVPSDLAMAFHYYCDEYNPLVKKSAIFFTLNLDKCYSQKSDKTRSLHAVIEKCLTEKWKHVPLDNIGPLLTRVVSVVVDLTSAF